MRWLYGFFTLLSLATVLTVTAQDAQTDLVVVDISIQSQVDAFGTTRYEAVGTIENGSELAYGDVVLVGDVLNEAEKVVGEAYGGLVDVCGNAILEPIQPGQRRRFSTPIDLFDDSVPESVTMTIEAEASAPEGMGDVFNPAIAQVSQDEVVRVEWIDDTSFRYAVGCPTDVFTTYDWYQYGPSGDSEEIEHPSVADVTPAFIDTTGIPLITQTKGRETDPTLFDRSMLIFAPDGSRAIFQNDLHDLYSIEPDGTFRRQVRTDLYQHTLQGYLFTPQAMFLAYYYGAYSDPVRYITATVRGDAVSLGINDVTPSVTVPGLTNDGQRVIISGTFPVNGEDVTGYFWQHVRSSQRELMFETNVLPGNNYPAPLFWRKDADTRYIYMIRPINKQPTLQCFHYESKTLTTLTPVPLALSDSERAGTWLSPNGETIALAAIGAHGGLWLIDLNDLPACETDGD